MASPESYNPTSERVTADVDRAGEDDYLILLFHLATYDFALPFVDGRRVLDFGCGTGYGVHRIAPRCASIVGVDVSADAIRFAQTRYSANTSSFRRIAPIEIEPLPFADQSFDVVLSFQVIEHVPDANRYLNEIRRVLSDDGVLILATPDRTTRLLRGQRPWNRYHLVEYDARRLGEALRSQFADVEMNLMSGDRPVIARELNRSRRLRWATLPFTFPGSPEPWRQAGLSGLQKLQARLSSHRRARGSDAAGGAPRSYSYDQTALRIAPGLQPSVNLVAVARSPKVANTIDSLGGKT